MVEKVIPYCSADTVTMPIEALTSLVKVDQDCTKAISEAILPAILQLFEKFHKDAMLAEDILDLLKAVSAIPNNDAFRKIVVPQVLAVV